MSFWIGVVPAVIQSDNEFVNVAFEELCLLLGSCQIFSTALRPQSQGIVERSHLDIRRNLAILIESYARSNPRRLPQFLRYVEHKLRHRSLCSGCTPYSSVHGFHGSSALSTALGAIEEIPQNIIWADWIRGIVEESKRIQAMTFDYFTAEATARARRHGERKPAPDFREGELVLVAKPFYEKGTGVILPQCDSPFTVSRVPTEHTVLLRDTLTGEPAFGGKPISCARVIRFRFPSDWSGPEPWGPEERGNVFGHDEKGMFIACAPKTSQFHRIHVARVEKVFQNRISLKLLCLMCLRGTVQALGKLVVGQFGPMREAFNTRRSFRLQSSSARLPCLVMLSPRIRLRP